VYQKTTLTYGAIVVFPSNTILSRSKGKLRRIARQTSWYCWYVGYLKEKH